MVLVLIHLIRSATTVVSIISSSTTGTTTSSLILMILILCVPPLSRLRSSRLIISLSCRFIRAIARYYLVYPTVFRMARLKVELLIPILPLMLADPLYTLLGFFPQLVVLWHSRGVKAWVTRVPREANHLTLETIESVLEVI